MTAHRPQAHHFHRALAERARDPARDLLTELDGLVVFAPGWLAR